MEDLVETAHFNFLIAYNDKAMCSANLE